MSKSIKMVIALVLVAIVGVSFLMSRTSGTQASSAVVATSTQSESEVDQMLRDNQEMVADKQTLEDMMLRLKELHEKKQLTQKSLEKVVDETYPLLITSRGKSMLMLDFYIKVLAENSVPK